MGLSTTLAMPSQAHIDVKAPDPVVTSLVGRKQSFRGFSASSLSSLALGRSHSKRSSLVRSSKSSTFLATGFQDSDSSSERSRPPSLITDKSSLTSASSRSPSPEPLVAVSRLEAAFKTYSSTQSPNVLLNILLPTLSLSRTKPVQSTDANASTTNSPRNVHLRSIPNATELLLEDSDINVLFKWWNHLLLLSPQIPATFQAIYAIAAHPSLRNTIFWNAHYELTLSTTLSLASSNLSSTFFAKLAALGYMYHTPTSQLLRSLFTDPTKVHSAEAWVKRAKNVEVFIETSKHVFAICPTFDDEGVIEARLEDMLNKVISVTSYPNNRLSNLARLIANAEGVFLTKLEQCLIRIAERVGVFDCVAVFYLLDILSVVHLTQIEFWLEVLQRIISTENHILLIRVFTFLYDFWPSFAGSNTAVNLLISGENWEHFFVHWSGIVRDHFMRLVAFKICLTHPFEVKAHLLRSFETSLLENCQLRDCLPSNPIPNKRLVIRPVAQRPYQVRQDILEKSVDIHADPVYDESANLDQPTGIEGAAGFVKKKLGLFRGLWADESKDVLPTTLPTSAPAPSRQTRNTQPTEAHADQRLSSGPANPISPDYARPLQIQTFRFIAEYVGKHWSLVSDEDAVKFLDSVMDAARDGRLPIHALPLPVPEKQASSESCSVLDTNDLSTQIGPYDIGQGRKKLWTRSLSEWSTLLDEADRFWTNCGGRSLSNSATSGCQTTRRINCPKLVVEFPRWFVQRSTQIAGDGVAEKL